MKSTMMELHLLYPQFIDGDRIRIEIGTRLTRYSNFSRCRIVYTLFDKDTDKELNKCDVDTLESKDFEYLYEMCIDVARSRNYKLVCIVDTDAHERIQSSGTMCVDKLGNIGCQSIINNGTELVDFDSNFNEYDDTNNGVKNEGISPFSVYVSYYAIADGRYHYVKLRRKYNNWDAANEAGRVCKYYTNRRDFFYPRVTIIRDINIKYH